MPQSYDSNRSPKQAKSGRRWVAMDVELIHNSIVGLAAKRMKPADPKRDAWSPMEAWFWMITEASHRAHPLRVMDTVVTLERGQLALAERRLADLANWGRTAAKNFLGKLELHGMISRATPIEAARTQKGQLSLEIDDKKTCHPLTIVTLCNYDKYQFGLRMKESTHVPPTNQESTRDKGQDSSVGPVGTTDSSSRADFAAQGTDAGTVRPPSEAALAEAEQLGFTRATLLQRWEQKTARRRSPIRDSDAYLITMAIEMAAKARGVPMDALRASLSKNRGERAEALGRASGAPPPVSDAMMRAVTRRCERRGVMVTAMLAAWHQRCAGLRVLHPDQSVDAFCSYWLDHQKAA